VSYEIRPASERDLFALEDIENLADSLLVERLRPDSWRPAPTADERAQTPGFLLVVAAEDSADPVGFAQILEVDGFVHLEQLSVLPAHGRRGLGRALVEAALAESARRGYDTITLRTFADVPWNGPFYASCGFIESEPSSEFHRGLARTESSHGLNRGERRIQMTARLQPPVMLG
jgi:GNAT superfamily N-acetyltransferase